MATAREFEELTARCVSIMVAYHGAGKSPQTTAEMLGEVKCVAREAMSLGHRAPDIVSRVLQPVESELLLRYGPELGVRITGVFLDAFEEEAELNVAPPQLSGRLGRKKDVYRDSAVERGTPALATLASGDGEGARKERRAGNRALQGTGSNGA